MPWSIADSNYDETHPWDSLYNGPAAMPVSPGTQQLMDHCEMLADPRTPASFIRDTMTHAPAFNWGPTRPEPTIESVLSGEAVRPAQASMTDFSGTPAGMEASVRNHISIGS